MTNPDVDLDNEAVESVALDYLKMLYKRRWLVLTTTALAVFIAAAYTFTATPVYQARARLLIEADRPNVVAFKEVIDQDQLTEDFYLTQYNILQSRALARRTLDELKLWSTPPFGGHPPAASLSRRVAAMVSSAVSRFRPSPNVVAPPAETAAQTRAIDQFLSNVIVAPVRNSRLVDIKYESPDPARAASIVNVLVKNYIDESLEYRFMASREASDWLGARLTEQRTQVERAEAALQAYRERNDTISPQEPSNIAMQKLTELNAALTQAKTVRLQKEASYQQLQSLLSNPAALDSFPAILSNPFIQQQKAEVGQLRSQYAVQAEKLGPKHPEMAKLQMALELSQTKLNTEIGQVVQGVTNDYHAALATEQSLTDALNSQKTTVQAMNRKGIDAGVLERDVQSSRQIYDSLLQRAKETEVSGELKMSNIRLVDRAEQPLKPVRPDLWLNLTMALMTGIVLACGAVSIVECLDNRIHTPAEMRKLLKLPDLGMLPTLHAGRNGTPHWPLINNGVPPNFSEAFRTIRANVLFASPHAPLRSLVVTSTGPSEGKSLVASNLAVSLAQTGKRILLVDADLRKPKMHQVFSVSQEPGLSNLLVGDATEADALRKSLIDGLWVLPAGRVPPNPAELVGSDRFQAFVSSLAGQFDWIVIDSPPVLAVADASLIAHLTTGVLFVISAEATSRFAAKRALDQLARPGVTLMGAILNRVDIERHPYYYSGYYRREYGAYYAPGPVSPSSSN